MDTTLKTPFHIALFRMKLRSHALFKGRISAMPGIRADLLLAVSKTGICLLTYQVFINVFLFWFPADQGLKKVYFMAF